MHRAVDDESPGNLPTFLDGVNFPAEKSRLVQLAREQGVHPKVLEALESLPEQLYQNREAVMVAHSAVE